MRTRTVFLALLVVIGAVTFGMTQGGSSQVADEVIAVVKAQWAASNQGNTAEAMKNVADEYTELNGDFATRLEGKEINQRLGEVGDKSSVKTIVSEMANPKVQVYGDVAILSYNYVGVTKDSTGKNQPSRAKSTRVYVKQGGKWMLVHANFGADPLPQP
jgi:ketosteroid isomerase-like protein